MLSRPKKGINEQIAEKLALEMLGLLGEPSPTPSPSTTPELPANDISSPEASEQGVVSSTKSLDGYLGEPKKGFIKNLLGSSPTGKTAKISDVVVGKLDAYLAVAEFIKQLKITNIRVGVKEEKIGKRSVSGTLTLPPTLSSASKRTSIRVVGGEKKQVVVDSDETIHGVIKGGEVEQWSLAFKVSPTIKVSSGKASSSKIVEKTLPAKLIYTAEMAKLYHKIARLDLTEVIGEVLHDLGGDVSEDTVDSKAKLVKATTDGIASKIPDAQVQLKDLATRIELGITSQISDSHERNKKLNQILVTNPRFFLQLSDGQFAEFKATSDEIDLFNKTYKVAFDKLHKAIGAIQNETTDQSSQEWKDLQTVLSKLISMGSAIGNLNIFIKGSEGLKDVLVRINSIKDEITDLIRSKYPEVPSEKTETYLQLIILEAQLGRLSTDLSKLHDKVKKLVIWKGKSEALTELNLYGAKGAVKAESSFLGNINNAVKNALDKLLLCAIECIDFLSYPQLVTKGEAVIKMVRDGEREGAVQEAVAQTQTAAATGSQAIPVVPVVPVKTEPEIILPSYIPYKEDGTKLWKNLFTAEVAIGVLAGACLRNEILAVFSFAASHYIMTSAVIVGGIAYGVKRGLDEMEEVVIGL